MKIDQCKEHCHNLNRDGSIAGYWWKPYRGGFCGCCKSLENLASNWPDATTYSLDGEEKCSGDKCIGYRGKQNKTVSGRTCQKWDSQSPHKHTRGPQKKPGFGTEGGHNFCRNPDGNKTIWCYTTDPKKRWENCEPIGNAGGEVDFTKHDKIAAKRYCKSSTTPEQGPNFKIDQCKEHCHKLNNGGNIKGYWWKPYRGGYCGCCKSLDNLASNWPDATTYRLETGSSDELSVDNQRWKIVYVDKSEKEATKGFDAEFKLDINRPFYIKSRLPMGRVVEAISANNAVIKRYAKGRTAQQWYFDRVTNTIKSQQWKSYSLDKQGNNLAVKATNSKWNQMFRWNAPYLVVEREGKVLDVQGGVDAENRNIYVWKKHGGLNQQWEIIYVEDWKPEPKKGEMNEDFGLKVDTDFYLESQLPKNRYLDVLGRNLVIKTRNGRKT